MAYDRASEAAGVNKGQQDSMVDEKGTSAHPLGRGIMPLRYIKERKE